MADALNLSKSDAETLRESLRIVSNIMKKYPELTVKARGGEVETMPPNKELAWANFIKKSKYPNQVSASDKDDQQLMMLQELTTTMETLVPQIEELAANNAEASTMAEEGSEEELAMPKDEIDIFDQTEDSDYVEPGEGDVTVDNTDEELSEEESPQSEDFSERGRDQADVEDVSDATVVKISKKALMSIFKAIQTLDARTKKIEKDNVTLRKELSAVKKAMATRPAPTSIPTQKKIAPVVRNPVDVKKAPSSRPPVSTMYRGSDPNASKLQKAAMDTDIKIGFGTDVNKEMKKLERLMEG